MENKSRNHNAFEEKSIAEQIAKSLIGSVVFSIGISVIKRAVMVRKFPALSLRDV